MKDFLVKNGDVVISGNDIQYVRDKELIRQKVSLVLQTNKGEWLLNADEGINFSVILIKNPNEDEILSTVIDGLKQIDETFVITDYKFETINRHLILTFTARNEHEEEISLAVGEITRSERTFIVAALTAEDVIRSANAIEAVCICDTDSYKIMDIL